MQIDEIQCHARLRRTTPGWTGSMQATVIIAKRMPPPDIRTTAASRFGILEHDHPTLGLIPYLLLSLTSYVAPTPRHESCLRLLDPHTPVLWFGSGNAHLAVNDGHFVSFKTVISTKDHDALFRHYGPPHPGGTANWLAARLLPRRWPAAVRYFHEPKLLMAYIPLSMELTHADLGVSTESDAHGGVPAHR